MATTETRTHQNYIGGEWVDAASGETFESTSPADGELIGIFPRSGADDVDRAVAAAKAAYEDWRLVPAPKRGEILFRFAQLVADHKAELTDLMTHEMGKVKAEAGGDVQEAIDMSFYMGGEGRRLFGQTTPSELRNKFQMSRADADRSHRRHHAVELPDRDPVVEDRACARRREHRRLQARDGHARARAALRRSSSPRPAFLTGVVNIVHGGGGAVGERLVRHPDVRVISLTGSRETGVKVLEAAAEGLKHVHLELGGKNAIIVMDDADLDLARRRHPLVGVRHVRPALHRDEPRHRPREPLRHARRPARRARRGAAPRPRLGGRHRRRSGHQRAPRSRRSTRTRRSARTTARRSSPAARSPTRATSRRASTTARPSSATSSRTCASRRRRSSARRSR